MSNPYQPVSLTEDSAHRPFAGLVAVIQGALLSLAAIFVSFLTVFEIATPGLNVHPRAWWGLVPMIVFSVVGTASAFAGARRFLGGRDIRRAWSLLWIASACMLGVVASFAAVMILTNA